MLSHRVDRLVLLAEAPGVSRPSIGDTPKPLFAELQFLAVASVSVPLFFLWEGIGSGFYLGDAFGSWHRWALDWFEGRLPVETWRYPQLMPTNWAAMYAVQGTPDVHFFAKSYMAIFPIAIQLVFIAVARATQKSRYFLGAILYAVVLVVFTNRYLINDGYADIAMSFLCFLSFMCLANWRVGQHAPWLHFGIVFACAAAVTKQPGLYWLAGVGIYLATDWMRQPERPRRLLGLVVYILMVALLVLPWWLYKELQIRSGIEVSEVGVIMSGAWSGLDTLGPFERATRTIVGNFAANTTQQWVGVILLFLFAASLTRPATYWSTLGVVMPFFLLWAFAFGYATDMRNVSLAIPFAALACAQGASALSQLLAVAHSISWARRKSCRRNHAGSCNCHCVGKGVADGQFSSRPREIG